VPGMLCTGPALQDLSKARRCDRPHPSSIPRETCKTAECVHYTGRVAPPARKSRAPPSSTSGSTPDCSAARPAPPIDAYTVDHTAMPASVPLMYGAKSSGDRPSR